MGWERPKIYVGNRRVALKDTRIVVNQTTILRNVSEVMMIKFFPYQEDSLKLGV
tara:strand:+ start:44 stop:205 length:162 start_codon:yes stop_codon:yes gene_type:complete